jgi:hypothetical protein
MSRAWKATLQNGLRVEFDYYDDNDTIEMFVSPTEPDSNGHIWQQLPNVEDRTPIVEVWDKLDIDRIWVATLADGDQILINYWHQTYFQASDEMTVAYREDRWSSWWAPITCEPITVTAGDVDDI